MNWEWERVDGTSGSHSLESMNVCTVSLKITNANVLPKSLESPTAKHVQKYHNNPSSHFSDDSVWIKLVDQPTNQHCHPCSRTVQTNLTRIQLNSKGNDYSRSVTIMSSQLNGHKGKWSKTEYRQERAFIQTCLTHHSKVVGLPLSCAPKRRLTGQP